MKVSAQERRKAQFISEYRQLCEKYGMMVSIEEGDDVEFDPITCEDTVSMVFTVVANVDDEIIDEMVQQLLIQDVMELEEDV